MEEKEFNELVAKLEKATGEKIEAQYNETFKDMDLEALKTLAGKDLVTKEDIEALDATNTELKEILETQGLEIEKIKTEAGPTKDKLLGELKEKKEALRAIATKQSREPIVIKALTLRSSVATNTIGMDLPGIGQLGNRKSRSFYDFLAKQVITLPQDHSGIIRYRDWDEATTVKAAAAVAEGAAFPESTATWKGYTLPIEKIGDTIPVTEEFFEDEPTLAGELNLFLQSNVLDKVANDVVLANGTSPNIRSIDADATAYTAPDLAITDANIYDLVIKVVEDITTNAGSKYAPDFVLMNIADINALKLKKDANNNYIFDRIDERLQPLTVIEDNHVASNTMYVGDSRYVRLYEIPGVEISTGMVNSQFTEDEMTLKARKRLAFLIRNVDKTGFRKVASISAALTTLGAP